MAWRIGIDEAGYGPNLGPLVMTAVACRVLDENFEADLWQLLGETVCRNKPRAPGCLFVDDSKRVYSSARGLANLEIATLAAAGLTFSLPINGQVNELSLNIGHLLSFLSPAGHSELQQEAWFTGTTPLPVAAKPNHIHLGRERFQDASMAAAIQWGPLRSVIVCPSRFNDLVDRWDSKAAVLAEGLRELVGWQLAQNTSDPVRIVVDKHGGRNHYSALVQEAVGDGIVLARKESLNLSEYEVMGLARPVRISFMPRADAGDFCVALASMISKYLREILMEEFNHFWRQEIPDLKPTAGYPVDAVRFFKAIAPARLRLAIPDRVLWRTR